MISAGRFRSSVSRVTPLCLPEDSAAVLGARWKRARWRDVPCSAEPKSFCAEWK